MKINARKTFEMNIPYTGPLMSEYGTPMRCGGCHGVLYHGHMCVAIKLPTGIRYISFNIKELP